MATNENGDDIPPAEGGDLPVPDPNYGGVVPADFEWSGLPGDDANKHLDKFLHVTQSIKVNEVTDDALHLSESSSSITSSSNPEIIALKAEMAEINKNLMKVLQINQQVKVVSHNCETCGGLHSYNDCPATVGQTQNVYAAGCYNQGGPTIPTTSSPPKVVESETKVTKDMVPPTNNESTKDVQPSVVQAENQIPNSEPVVAPVGELVDAPVIALKPNPKPSIPYSSRLHDQKLCDKDNDQKEKIFQIFQDLNFDISFADALILMPKSFLKTGRALIDVYGGELTLCVGNKAITFNLDQTSRYSTNYDAMSVNRIDLIDVACEEYSQEVLEFFVSSNPTPSTEPIVSISSPTLTPSRDNDFLLEETDAFLAIDDEPISPEIDDCYYDSEGDILLEEFLNDDPSSLPLPPQELKVVEPKNKKSSIDESPVVELKDLPPHLEYAFLEGDDKLPVIISKDLKDEEKTALIKVLKSHKQALTWQLSDTKGINLEFCTYRILMEDDFKPAVQHHRRVNLKIHEVIKKEVLKLLNAELIYPISDSPWVSPVHCVPKKGGFTVVENEEN
nr:reverse transcriptase domain-containing protein [Tanacetum cinerariifolium]